jgi:ClpA/ClpB-like protein
MIELDVAGLVVIAGQVLGIGTDAALSQLDIPAAEAALTEARLAGQQAASAAARSRRPGSAPAPPHRAPAGIRTPATGLMPFTGPALSSVILSRQEARRHGQPRGLEHILLGLAGQDDSVAVKALERLGISQEAIRRQAENITGQSQPQAQPPQAPDTPQARRVWHAVLDEAVAHGDSYIGTEHFLLGLLCHRDAPVVQALASLGAEENQVRTAITAQRAESGPERPARWHGVHAR